MATAEAETGYLINEGEERIKGKKIRLNEKQAERQHWEPDGGPGGRES